jgi:RNA polymerase sigma-70 factor (ECF subfamily)
MPEPAEQPVAATDARIAAAAAGDPAAWESLVDAYGRRVWGLLRRRCGDAELAEELTQHTFVKVYMALTRTDRRYEDRGKFEAWLFRVATNAWRDERRRRSRHARPTDMSPGGVTDGLHLAGGDAADDDPSAAMEQQERHQQLREAVARLPEADQQVLYLRHTAQLSFTQIAETLEQPLGTVLARAHRAVGKLRKMMQPEVVES